jgi:hypothetical protein
MRIWLALLMSTILVSGAAHAQQSRTDVRTFPVNGNVPGTCTIGSPVLAPGEQINFRGLNGNTLQIDQLVDATTLSTRGASVVVRFEAICSFPHRLKVETQNNGLFQTSERSAAAPEGFGDAVPYTAFVEWGDKNLEVLADAVSRRTAETSTAVDAITAGDLRIRLEVEPGDTNLRANAPLLAGVYGDTLRITLEPQQ